MFLELKIKLFPVICDTNANETRPACEPIEIEQK